MSTSKIAVPGQTFFQELATTQFVIPAGASGAWSNAATSGSGVVTVTTNAAHGLSLNPAAGTAPNYFIQFATAFTVLTGAGVGLNQIFRILSIPTTTTFTVWSSILTATITSTTFVPIFFPTTIATPNSAFINGPVMTTTSVAPMMAGSCDINYLFGANCILQYAPGDYTGSTITPSIPLDQYTNGGVTPSSAPTYRTFGTASAGGQATMTGYSMFIAASGTTATSQWSVVE